jgi:hypothetical protein
MVETSCNSETRVFDTKKKTHRQRLENVPASQAHWCVTINAMASTAAFKPIALRSIHSSWALREHQKSVRPFVAGPVAFGSLQRLIGHVRQLRKNAPPLEDALEKRGCVDWSKRPHTLFTHGGTYDTRLKCSIDGAPWQACAARMGAVSVCVAPHLHSTWAALLDAHQHQQFRTWQTTVSTTSRYRLQQERVRVVPWFPGRTTIRWRTSYSRYTLWPATQPRTPLVCSCRTSRLLWWWISSHAMNGKPRSSKSRQIKLAAAAFVFYYSS